MKQNNEFSLKGTKIEVRNNDVSGAMRKLKKIVTTEGILKEYRDRQFYTPPSEKRRLKKAAAIRRYKKEKSKLNDL
jgi:small subunit ribosomal protein S21